jgi:hypothetical protein
MSRKFLKHGWALLGILLLVAFLVFPACTTPITPTTNLLLRVASTDVLVDPWNPVAGSNWVYDRFPQTATQDMSVVPDPNTGLYVPWRLEKADVVVEAGLPVGVTAPNNEWLNLSFTSSGPVQVPADAWADWNAKTQQWITAGSGVTAKTKTVAYYPKTIFNDLYHDGSKLSPADFILAAILNFDRAKPDSDIYDEGYVAAFDAFMDHFKGVTFDFSNPDYGLVVTTYDDLWYLDAELIVGLDGPGWCWYPLSAYGEFNFENLALGILAEANGELAFGGTKATANHVEWMSFVSGPSLNILAGHLTDVQTSGNPDYEYIPYSPTLGTYITGEQALERYNNLQNFYNTYHHFWVGTGPYYLNTVNTSGKVLDLKKFTDYNMPGDLFFSYMDPVPTGPVPSVTGGWLDEIVMSKEATGSAAVTRLANNDLDVYAYPLADPDLKATVDNNPDLTYYACVGSFDEFSFNPAANATHPFFSDGRLNPFAVPAIREAMNKAIDRDYLCNDIMGGLGLPRYTCIGAASTDAVKFESELAQIASQYAYNFGVADAAIQTAMLAIPGVTRGTDGNYMYSGSPVAVTVIIRSDGHERKDFGDYVVTVLQDLGFAATGSYKTSTEASPIWRGSDPDLGLWNVYTGGWVSTSISLDEGSNFGAFYTPLWAAMGPLWQAYTPTEEFMDVSTALWNNDFTTVAQRKALFDEAIPLSMQDSVRIFLVDLLAFEPVRTTIAVASDKAGGIAGAYMWATTVHFQNASGVPTKPGT